jgi:transposase
MERGAFEQLSKADLISSIVNLQERLTVLEQRNVALERRNAELERRNAALEVRCTKLEAELAKARKDSSNSSKPPSSDIVKPPKTAGHCTNGKIGGQPGHERHQRSPFAPEQVDKVVEHKLKRCPDCGGPLRPAKRPARVVQQVELVDRPVIVTEHRALAYECRGCGKVHYPRLPPRVVLGGLLGPRLTATAAFLKGACHASYTALQAFLGSALGVPVSRGYLVKQLAKLTRALDGPYGELVERVRSEPRVNVDETGHKEKGRSLWTWCFRSPAFTLFRIDPSRGSDVLDAVLTKEFRGLISCDYFSAYRKYMADADVQVQFCLAHLIRDVKFLMSFPDRSTRSYAGRMLGALRRLFRVIHRRPRMSEERFRAAIERERRDFLRVAKRAPMGCEAQNLAKRFRLHGDAYFRFITTPGVEPTNNLAEQALRFVVIDRRITQGTRGRAGRRWCERVWTALATCAMPHRSAFGYLHQTIHSHFLGQPAPSLLPALS